MNPKKKNNNGNTPECFGIIDIVFPMGEDGLRATPETCFACPHKTQCLRTAMKGIHGYTVKEEFIDRAYSSGRMGFVERWAKKKDLHRRKKIREENTRESRKEE